ncbi:hypothetical protein LCGC14_2690290, partial [marine sediment metagenome]
PGACQEVFVAPEPRRLVGEVHAGHPATGTTLRIAKRSDDTGRRLGEDVLLHPEGTHLGCRDELLNFAGSNDEGSEVRVSHSAVHLSADVQRHLLAVEQPDAHVDFGILDITFYRDDLSRRRGVPLVRATEIDFDLDDTWALLIDDVLQTGRSIRAALDALHDFGRPKVVRLAVLIDRGGRELPIAADYVGKSLRAPAGQRVQVKLKENDAQEGAYVFKKA